MSDSSELPWSNNPYAPKIPYHIYFGEKAVFAGILIGSMLYGARRIFLPYVPLSVFTLPVRFILGIVIVLFFKCMAALLDPIHRRTDGTKWGLVGYTMVMFSFVTIFTGMNLNMQSVSFIDNREFPGVEGSLPAGPLGYQWLVYSKALSIVPNLMFLLNNWLADGLLVGSLFDAMITRLRA